MADLQTIVERLLKYDNEKEWFEFKENWFELDELGRYISALANAAAMVGLKYAYLVWGINDKTHEIVGTRVNFDKEIKGEPIKHYLARNCSPENNFTFDDIVIRGKRVVVLTIPAAKVAPVAFNGDRYIRIGSSKVNLRNYPEKEASLFRILTNGLPTIINTPSEYQNLSFSMLFGYYASKGINLNPDTFKENLSLCTEDGKYNLLAQLLADDSHISIRVAIFSGKTKADKLFSVKECGHQCLLFSMDEVLRYGEVLFIPITVNEERRIVEREEVPLFDIQAYREAVINAFIHNKWVEGANIMFTVYSDRIEIVSEGGLPPEWTVDDFFSGKSKPVNEKLAEIGIQLHISEKTGRGVPYIISKYGRSIFNFGSDSITVTIPYSIPFPAFSSSSASSSPKKIPAVFANPEGLTAAQEKFLNEIRNNPNITKPQLEKILGISKSTADRYIAVLRKRGIVERVGSNKKGYWKVNS